MKKDSTCTRPLNINNQFCTRRIATRERLHIGQYWIYIGLEYDADLEDDDDDKCDIKNGELAGDVWAVLWTMCSRREGKHSVGT